MSGSEAGFRCAGMAKYRPAAGCGAGSPTLAWRRARSRAWPGWSGHRAAGRGAAGALAAEGRPTHALAARTRAQPRRAGDTGTSTARCRAGSGYELGRSGGLYAAFSRQRYTGRTGVAGRRRSRGGRTRRMRSLRSLINSRRMRQSTAPKRSEGRPGEHRREAHVPCSVVTEPGTVQVMDHDPISTSPTAGTSSPPPVRS